MGKADYWAKVDLSGAPGASLELKVNDTKLPIAQFTMTYELNAIPTATALIALGRNAKTGDASAIYKQAADIRRMAKVVVTLKGNLGDWSAGGAGAKKKFNSDPKKSYVLFVGYVAGLSYRRASGKVSLALNLTNQLVDLALAATGNANIVPGNPGDYFLPLLPPGSGVTYTAATASGLFTHELPITMSADFSRAILDVLLKITKDSPFTQGKSWCTRSRTLNKNEGLIKEVIEGSKDGIWLGISNFGKNTNNGSKYPLQLHPMGTQAVTNLISERITGSMVATSLWGTLIQAILPEFGCGVIPTAQTAIVAPVLGMAQTAGKEIQITEYADFDMTTMSQRPLKAVSLTSVTHFSTVKGGTTMTNCVGATYENTDSTDGLWMFVPSPAWLSGSAWVVDSAVDKTANSLNSPTHSVCSGKALAPVKVAEDTYKSWDETSINYAKLIYSKNALRGREGMLVGKLRFDVSPGMTIKIKGDSARNVGIIPALTNQQLGVSVKIEKGVDTLATDLYAFVSGVVVNINAEDQAAATTFKLTNIRTAAENSEDGLFSMTVHPFFNNNYFRSAPLVLGIDP